MDELYFTSFGRRWRAALHASFDLAIPLEFDGPQPQFFADRPASAPDGLYLLDLQVPA